MKQNDLHKIKNTGFNVPKDYFETFEAKLYNRINFSLDTPQDAGFRAPEDYFESFEDAVLKRVLTEDKGRVITLFSNKKLSYVASIAAALIILIGLPILNQEPTFDSLETETVENYIISENISSYEIASLLSDEQLEEDIYVTHDLEKETIETYLLNNIEVEDLILE